LAQVKDNIFAPEAQAFQAIVVRANDSLTVDGVARLVSFAKDGLQIVFSGGIPSSYLGTNQASALQSSKDSLNQIAKLPNVHVTNTYDGLALTLASIGIQPAASFMTPSPSWYTSRRSDPTTGADYYYIYNDAMELPAGQGTSTCNITFHSTGIPYMFDAYTGEQAPIYTYTQTKNSTVIPVTLAGNQSTILAFLPKYLNQTGQANAHVTYKSENILNAEALQNGSIVLKVGPGTGASSYSLQDGGMKSITTTPLSQITITNWTLTVEHWDPPNDLFDIEGGASKHNTTHSLLDLVSWQQIPGLQNVSGRGYYSAFFTWPPTTSSGLNASELDGAIINFGSVVHTLRASINGNALPPLDVTAAKTDISQWLVNGQNLIEAVVSTPLGNVLNPIWDQLQTSGTGPTSTEAGGPPPPVANYGLLDTVTVMPYEGVVVS
jgi:hypothetical protein